MISIMHICSDSIVGGATVTLLRLIKNSDMETFRHIVILPQSNPLYTHFRQLDIDLLSLDAQPDRSFTLRGVYECMKYIRAYRPDIIHTHGAVFGRMAGYICGVKSLLYTRHTYRNRSTSAIRRFINRRMTTKAVAVSRAVIDQIAESGIDRTKIRLIENGCDDMYLDNKKNRNSANCRLLFLGRLTEEKGIQTALGALSVLNRESKAFSLTIAGDGKVKEYIDRYVSSNNLSECVTLLPFRSDVRSILAENDILLNCSYENEATSLSIIEAYSASLPVCASNVAGNVHIVSNGIDGELYKSGDAFGLAEAILTVWGDYEKYASNARKKYQNRFTATRMTEEYEKLWKEEYERLKS